MFLKENSNEINNDLKGAAEGSNDLLLEQLIKMPQKTEILINGFQRNS